ncbi:MAG: AMIN domain-containing protein [Actinomycetaceae bacterium]|nr:AMIN domain-containing protein [Actinomycetaceae bacterium]
MKHNKVIAYAAIAALSSATLLTACSSNSIEGKVANEARTATTPAIEQTESTEDTQTGETAKPSEAGSEESPSQAPAESSEDSYIDSLWTLDPSHEMPTDSVMLLAHDFRVGDHDGYYRVVVEFVGTGVPGWSVEWGEESREIARGEVLPIPTGHVLDVMIHGAGTPTVAGAPEYYYNGPADKWIDDNNVAWFDGSFEGETHLAISSDKFREYRVFTLEEPKRLVIDLKK